MRIGAGAVGEAEKADPAIDGCGGLVPRQMFQAETDIARRGEMREQRKILEDETGAALFRWESSSGCGQEAGAEAHFAGVHWLKACQ